MKIHVLYDKEGNIISAGIPLPPTYDFRGPKFGPMAQEDQYKAEFDVIEEHASLGLVGLAGQLKIEIKGKEHRLVSKSKS